MSKESSKFDNKENICFVIMPISDPNEYASGHFKRVYEHIIKPACVKAGLTPKRADESTKSNVIMGEILKDILNCDIAICDLSSRNPNVFYELGLRQAFNKKTVLIKDEKTSMPFDISSIRAQDYNSNLRIDLVSDAVNRISSSLIDTVEMSKDESNSLLSYLSIVNPAKLPKTKELSADSSLILLAIEDLQKRIFDNPDKVQIGKKDDIFFLPNGCNVSVGDTLMYKDRDRYREYGHVVSINKGVMFVETSGRVIRLDRIHPDLDKLTTLPF